MRIARHKFMVFGGAAKTRRKTLNVINSWFWLGMGGGTTSAPRRAAAWIPVENWILTADQQYNYTMYTYTTQYTQINSIIIHNTLTLHYTQTRNITAGHNQHHWWAHWLLEQTHWYTCVGKSLAICSYLYTNRTFNTNGTKCTEYRIQPAEKYRTCVMGNLLGSYL